MPQTLIFDPRALRESAQRACDLLKALGNADRLLLLCQLTQGERCVSELEQLTGIRQPSLSQQLAVLREESLVATRRDGKHIYYSVRSPAALAVMQVLYDHFCDKGAAQSC